MLNYDPDGLSDGAALWAMALEGEALSDDRLLASVIAACRNTAHARGPVVQPGFQPERVSGFCAG